MVGWGPGRGWPCVTQGLACVTETAETVGRYMRFGVKMGSGGAFFENGVFGQKWPKWPRSRFVPRPRSKDVLRPPFSSPRAEQVSSMVGGSRRRPGSMQHGLGVGSNPGRAGTLFLPPFFFRFFSPDLRRPAHLTVLRLPQPAAACCCGRTIFRPGATFFGAILAPEGLLRSRRCGQPMLFRAASPL